jgi:hypothetical protein
MKIAFWTRNVSVVRNVAALANAGRRFPLCVKASFGLVLIAAIQGCVALPVRGVDYVRLGAEHRNAYRGSHEHQRSPSGIFPYGSRVACPQVSIGNGMARCQ